MSNISDILITLGRLARGHDSISKINLDHDSSKKLADYIYQKHQEIERLNNIIKRLETDLYNMYITFGEYSEEYTKNCIKKLKEGG